MTVPQLLLVAVFVIVVYTASGLLVVRQQRRLLAPTGWPAWDAERRKLPRATRRRVERAVVRGREVSAADAGIAVRHADALLESLTAHRDHTRRPAARRWFVAAAVGGTLALAVNLAAAVVDPTALRVLTAGVFVVLVPLWVLLARGHDITARRAARVRTARDLAARRLAEEPHQDAGRPGATAS